MSERVDRIRARLGGGGRGPTLDLPPVGKASRRVATPPTMAERAGRGALIGAGTGLLGGPVGVVTGALGGAAGELAAYAAEEHGAGLPGQIGAGGLSDVAVSMATRRPTAGLMGSLGRLSMAAEGAKARAGGWLGDLSDDVLTSHYGPAEAIEGIQRGYADLGREASEAWKRFRGTQPERIPVSTTGIRRAGTGLSETMAGGPSVPKEILRETSGLPRTIDLRRLQNLRAKVGATVAEAGTPGQRGFSKAAELYPAIDEAAEIAGRASPTLAEEALPAWRRGIGATSEIHEAVPVTSATYRQAIAKAAPGQPGVTPEKAIQRIVSAGPDESKRVMRLLENDPKAMAGLRRSALQRIYGRIYGGTGTVPRKAAALLERGSAERAALEPILGEELMDRVLRTAREITEHVSPPGQKVSAPLQWWRAMGGGAGATSGVAGGGLGMALLGTQNPQMIGATVAATAALPAVARAFANTYGMNTARKLFLEALGDPDAAARLMRKAGTQEKWAKARQLAAWAVRRGILTEEEIRRVEEEE